MAFTPASEKKKKKTSGVHSIDLVAEKRTVEKKHPPAPYR